MPKAKLNPFDTITEKTLRAAVDQLPEKTRHDLLSIALGLDFEAGNITIPDGDDIPPHLREANRKRIDALPADVRASFLGQN